MEQITRISFLQGTFLTALLFSLNTHAEVESNFSGFGTVGYSISDQPYSYLKYIDSDGTFLRDSLIGGQLDVRFNSKWSATIQGLVASDETEDTDYKAKLSWGFLSYRPTSDWLLRAGKLRSPGFLNSANRDVGITYDSVRIPAEYDTVTPVYDFLGASVSKTFALEESDITLDVYWGVENYDWRYYITENVGDFTKGGYYSPVKMEVFGSALKYEVDTDIYLASFYYTKIKNDGKDSWIEKPGYTTSVPSGVGYYYRDTANGKVVDDFDVYIVNIGADIDLGNDFRLATEFAVRRIEGLDIGLDTLQGYISLRKRIGDWTPYISYAQIKTDSDKLNEYLMYMNTEVPTTDVFADQINASQNVMADTFQAYDQHSISIGTSYRITPTNVIKAEIMRVHVGQASKFFDAVETDNTPGSNTTVFTFSYSFVF